jgi:hypothetical protein
MSPFNKNLTPINGRLVAYATLAGAALAAPAIPSADATIVYSGIVNFSIPNNFDGLYINFVTGATGTSSAAVPGANFNPYNGGTGLQFFWNAAQNGGLSLDTTTYATLAAGTPISSANTFLNVTSVTATAAWRAGSNLYLGVRLTNSQTSATNFGWVHLNTTGSTGFPATIVDYAYDDSGAAILAGQVPEPTTFALLGVMAAGAVGVRAWRKRKAA